MKRLRTFLIALLAASMAFNGMTFEVEAEGESLWDGGKVIEVQQRLEIISDPLAKGEKVSGTYDLSDPANVTSVSDTWNYMRDVFEVQGSFVGGASQENLITLTNATTSSGGAMDILGLFRAPPDAIMSGASEGWFRIPISIHPMQNVSLKFYHVENPKKFEVVESSKSGYAAPALGAAYPEPAPQMNPTMVWSQTYDWDGYGSSDQTSDLNHLSYTGNWSSFDQNTVPPNLGDVAPYSTFISKCNTPEPSPWDNTCSDPMNTAFVDPWDQAAWENALDLGVTWQATRIDTPDNASTSKWFRTYLWWSFAWYPDEWYMYHVRYDTANGGSLVEPHLPQNDFLPQTIVNETMIYTSTADLAYDDIYQSTIWTRGAGNGFDAGTYTDWDLGIDLGVSMIFTEGLGYGMRGDNLTRNGFNSESELGVLRIPSCPGGYDGSYGNYGNSAYGVANEPSYASKMVQCIRYDGNLSEEWVQNGFEECDIPYVNTGTVQCLEWDSSTEDESVIGGHDYAHFGNNFYNGQPSGGYGQPGGANINGVHMTGPANSLDLMITNQGCQPKESKCQPPLAPKEGGIFLNLEDNIHLECGNGLLGSSPAWSDYVRDDVNTIPTYCNWNFNPEFGCNIPANTWWEEKCVQEPSLSLGAEKTSALYGDISQITISGVFNMRDMEDENDFPCGNFAATTNGGETDSFDGSCSTPAGSNFLDTDRYNKCEAYENNGLVGGPTPPLDEGALCPVLSQWTKTVCEGTNFCYTTQEPIGWRIYVYDNTKDTPTGHPYWDCLKCIVAEFGDYDTNQFVTAFVGQGDGEGDCDVNICEDEWYYYSASFMSYPDATGGSTYNGMPIKPAIVDLCMGHLEANSAAELLCTHDGSSLPSVGCSGGCWGKTQNSNLVSIGNIDPSSGYNSGAGKTDTAYWYGPGRASVVAAAPQYGGHFFGSFALDMVYREYSTFEDVKTKYFGMEQEALTTVYGPPNPGEPKAMRDIPLFIHDGIIFFDKFDGEFDASKDRMTFTMPFMRSGEPHVKTLGGDDIQTNDTLVIVMAIGLDENFEMLSKDSWTACSQLVRDHIICSGRDTDIDLGYYGPNAATNAWGMAYVGDGAYDDFYDARPVSLSGAYQQDPRSCDGDECLDGATYVKFVMGWNHILPYTPKERMAGGNYGNYDGTGVGENYDDNQLQSFYSSNGFEMPVRDLSYWLHDKYGNAPDTSAADYMFLNSVYYLNSWTPTDKCEAREQYTAIVDETYCTGYYQNGTLDDFSLFREHKGSYGNLDISDMIPDFDLWEPHTGFSGGPNKYWLDQPLYRTTGCTRTPNNPGEECLKGGWIKEKHRNMRPFHTFETSSGTWTNLNPVQYINQFNFNVVLVLDNVTYENAEFWEIYPNFVQEVQGGSIVIDDVAFKGTGYSFDWTVASGINGADKFKELYIWLENNKRQQISEGSITEVEGATMKDATADWKARLLSGIVELAEWFTAQLFALVTFIVSRLQTTISTIIDVSLFLIPFSIFAIGVAICFAWLKISIAAIRGEWGIVEQLIDGGGFLAIKAAFINVKELREYE